jgi:RNA polymerase primary sigma factor
MPAQADELILIAALRSGDPAAISRFIAAVSTTVWRAVGLVTGDETEARDLFLDIMGALRANHFARLASFSGKSTLETFVALTIRELLTERVMRLLQTDREKGWRAFERLFEPDLMRLIRRRIPGNGHDDARRDAWQDICVALIEDDYRRLKSYNGSGSFAGFVLRMIDRLLIDHVRSVASRRRLPAAVLKLAPLDQDVFKLIAWRRMPASAELLQPCLRVRLGTAPDLAAVEAALLRVQPHAAAAEERIRLVESGAEISAVVDDSTLTPEDAVVANEQQRELAAAVGVLERTIATFPAEERLYLTIALGGSESRPSREIARLMRRPVEDIYKLKQRVMTRLRDALAADDVVKIWRASV